MLLSCLKSFLSAPIIPGLKSKVLNKACEVHGLWGPDSCFHLQLWRPALPLGLLLYSGKLPELCLASSAISAWSSSIGLGGCVLTSSVWLDCLRQSSFLLSILGCSVLHYNWHFIAACLFYSADLINVLCGQGSCSHYSVWASNSAWPIIDTHWIWTEGRILWRRECLARQPWEIKVKSC